MPYQPLLNKEKRPSQEEIVTTIGERSSLWLKIHKFIAENYDFSPELVFWGKKYGWAIRYRKGGKTLGYFFPEANAFSVLLVLGSKEAETREIRFRNVFGIPDGDANAFEPQPARCGHESV